jgi:hypothetical protein
MRRAACSLLLLTLLLAGTGAALPEPSSAPDPSGREDALQSNRALLESWKQDSDHYARLQRDLKRFWKLPRERRDQLRKLDRELYRQEPSSHKLRGVLERYYIWLERLPPAEHERIDNAPDTNSRLQVIREIRERQWIKRLPPPVRNRVEGLKGKEREDEIARLRAEQRQRDEDALKGQPPARPPRRDRVMRYSDLSPHAQAVFDMTLKSRLSLKEQQRLADAEGKPEYLRELVKLARKHKVYLPDLGPFGPR